MTVPLRAALYLRVSTARQAEHDISIPDQRKQGEAYCALIRQPSLLEGLRRTMRGFRFRCPVATAMRARQGMARVRPAARRVPGGCNGRQADAPGVTSRSAG